MEYRTKHRLIEGINNFPVGGTYQDYNLNKLVYLTSKAAVISHLADFEEGLTEKQAREIFEIALESNLPESYVAEGTLKLSSGFINDYNKIQTMKEHKSSYDTMMRILRIAVKNYGTIGKEKTM